MASMTILQNVDKCIRCNGCVIACKRTWQLKGEIQANELPHQKVAQNQRMVIKPQKKVDTSPFVRYSCWHCTNPPCTGRCPWGAIKQDAASGAVYIDPVKCTPDATPKCKQVCQYDCQHAGYIRVGTGSIEYPTERKAQKCTMCYQRAGAGGDLPSKNPYTGTLDVDEVYLSPLKADLEKAPALAGRAAFPTFQSGAALVDLAHQPACVCSCPAQTMFYDTQANAGAYLDYCLSLPASDPLKIAAVYGSGHMIWFSRKYAFTAPKADPFIEDHISPMVGNLLSSPFAKAALVPTLVAGGLLALSARRASIAEEQGSLTGGEAR